MLFPPRLPRLVPALVPVAPRGVRSARRDSRASLLFRGAERFAHRWSEEPGRVPPPAEEKPLSDTEKILYIAFGIWVALTFVALFVMVILLHSPLNAN